MTARGTARTLGMLALLTATLPVDAAVTAVALVRSAARRSRPRPTAGPARTVLLTGGKMTKAVALARAFHRAGHRVVLVDTARYRLSGHRFSSAVDRFRVVPDATDPAFAPTLRDIVEDEDVDVVVPVSSPVSSRYEALAARQLPTGVEVVHVDADVVDDLDDKHRFARTAERLGLGVPETHLVTSTDDVLAFDFPDDGRRWVLKSVPYDPVRRLDLTPLPRPTRAETEAFVADLPISPQWPWILQELVDGQEYCTHATVRGGRITAWACCESSPFQVNYAMVHDPEILAWVTTFCAGLELTGQVSFDFMRTPDGRLVALECNPRTHSAITMFHDHPSLADAYLTDPSAGAEPLVPLPGSRPTYWWHHELWRMVTDPRRIPERLRVVLRGTDALLHRDDPLPFLLVPHLQVVALLLDALRRGADWVRIDVNIGKLVEVGGD